MRSQDLSGSISTRSAASSVASAQKAEVPPPPIKPGSQNPFLPTQQLPAGSAPNVTNLEPPPAAALPSPVPSVSSHASAANAVDVSGDSLATGTTSTPPPTSAGPPARALSSRSPPSEQPVVQAAVTQNSSNETITHPSRLESTRSGSQPLRQVTGDAQPQFPYPPPPSDATWMQWEGVLEVLKSQVEEIQSSATKRLAMERISVLQDAFLEKDPFFLLLHQLYCLRSVCPDWYAQIPELQRPGCPQAMLVLESLLMDNRDLPSHLLVRFTIFPDAPQKLMQKGWCKLKLQEISRCLTLFATQRLSLLSEIYQRQCPPLLCELKQRFGVTSLVFFSVIFVDVCRHLYEQPYLDRLNKLFFQDRAMALRQRFSGRDIAAEQKLHKNLIREYRKIPLKPPQTTLSPQSALAGAQAQDTPQMVPSANRQSPRVGSSASASSPSAITSPVVVSVNNMNTTYPSALTSPPGMPGLPNNPSPHLSQAAQNSASCQQHQQCSNAHAQTPPVYQAQMYPSMLVNAASRALSPIASEPRQSPQGQGFRLPRPHHILRSDASPPASQAVSQGPHIQLVGQQPIPSQLPTPSGGPGPSGQASLPWPVTYLLPPANYRPPMSAHPNSLRLALHQADLREPVKKLTQRGPNRERVDIELFQYMIGFTLAPIFLDPEKSSHDWTFLLSSADCQRFPRTLDQGMGQRLLQVFQPGCRTFRLRSIRMPTSARQEAKRIWHTAPTAWPSVFYIFVNDKELFVRRKLHNGRDLPLDITNHLREGPNRITIHMLLDPDECKYLQYVFGVEVLEAAEFTQVKSMVRIISAADSRATIQKRLTSTINDDEVAVVTDNLTVSLLDPFSAVVFKIPARSIWCDHQECFDLDTFLKTRKSVSGTAPMNDDWRCPICKADARPQCLIVDSFLAEIRQELARSNRLDGAQAIQIKSDGSWNLKVVNDDSSPRTWTDSSLTLKRKADGSAHSESDSDQNRQAPHRKIKENPDRCASTQEGVVIELD